MQPAIFTCLLLATLTGPNLSADQIVERMKEQDQARQELLQQYEVQREYYVINQRFKHQAVVLVKLTYQQPDQKHFEIVSEQGNGVIRKMVIRRLIQAEEDNARSEAAEKNAIDSDNYAIVLTGDATIRGRDSYVLAVTPRRKDVLLFAGKVYVDKEDFAVARIEGSPARNPSFWTTRVDFTRDYQKVGDLWLPMNDASITEVRMFGRSELIVTYSPYKVVLKNGAFQ